MTENKVAVKGKGFFSRDEILELDDRSYEDIAVPQWGGKKVRISSMTASERDAFEATMFEGRGSDEGANLENLRARLIQRTAVDSETGILLFELGDIEALGRKNAAPMDLLFAAAMRVCGMSKKDVKDMTENLEGDRALDSVTA